MAAQNVPHPVQALNALCKRYPNLTQQVNAAWSKKLADPGLWPDWCLLPMDEWARIIDQQESMSGKSWSIKDKYHELNRLCVLGTWRYSQGIYRIDKDLQQALLESNPGKNIPAEVLVHMPEWCIYVETPHMMWHGQVELYGFWAHLIYSREEPYPKLHMMIQTPRGEYPHEIPIGNWTVEEALEREIDAMRKALPLVNDLSTGVSRSKAFDSCRRTKDQVERLLSLLLYCCCDKPDIDDARQPGTSPQRPQAKQVKGGFRLFPASAPRFWTVGNNIGEQLRQAQQDNQEKETSCGSGRSRRLHLRRGHWHGYWTGPRKSEVPQKFILHWIPPQLIRGSGEEKLYNSK